MFCKSSSIVILSLIVNAAITVVAAQQKAWLLEAEEAQLSDAPCDTGKSPRGYVFVPHTNKNLSPPDVAPLLSELS